MNGLPTSGYGKATDFEKNVIRRLKQLESIIDGLPTGGTGTSAPTSGDSINGRLTLTSGVPVETSAVLAATTLYFTPYKGNIITLYIGSSWVSAAFTQVSLSLSGYTADSNFDIFAYSNVGTLTLESLIWTNASTRATALAYQDGRLVKSGDPTRLYLGTIRTTGNTGECENSRIKRFVSNYYNRIYTVADVPNHNNHNYGGPARLYNNSTSENQLEFVMGVSEDFITFGFYDLQTAGVDGEYAIINLYQDGVQTGGDLWNGNAFLVQATQMGIEIMTPGYHYFNVYERGQTASAFFADMSLRVAAMM